MVLKVLKQLNLPPEKIFSLSDDNEDLGKASRPWELLPPGHVIGTPAPLFKELVRKNLYHVSFKILLLHSLCMFH